MTENQEKKPSPLFSFIVPVYNTSTEYLEKCVDSILGVTLDIELLIVDDGSTDEKLNTFYENYAAHPAVRVIRKPNGGVSSARNTGLENARGEFIVFADADDFICGDIFEEAAQVVSENPSVDLFCFNYNVVKQTGKFRHRGKHGDHSFTAGSFSAMRVVERGDKAVYFNSGVVWAKIYRRSLISDLKFDKDIRFSEDTIFNFDVEARVKRFVCALKPWYCYRVNSASVGHRYRPNVAEDFAKTALKMREKYREAGIPEEQTPLYEDIILCFFTEYVLQISVYNRSNPASRKQKNRQALQILQSQPYAEALEKLSGRKLSFAQSLIYKRLKAGKPRQAYLLFRLKENILFLLRKK